jgi:hypothetical protein
MLCPQLKQNLETIKTLKSELDLELSKIEKLFKDLKKGDPLTSLRAERKELINKIKEIKNKVNSNINELNTKSLEKPKLALKQTWRKIYKNWFDKEINISDIKIPEDYNPEKHFGLIIPGNLTMNEIAMAMRKKFKERGQEVSIDAENLNTVVNKNDRPTDKSYAILFKNNIEADEDLKGLSADDLEKKGIKGITLKERLLMEILYFDKTGEHLDSDNYTLCSGSRDSDGDVPRVDWSSKDSKLCVRWYSPDYSESYLRSRLAVSGF